VIVRRAVEVAHERLEAPQSFVTSLRTNALKRPLLSSSLGESGPPVDPVNSLLSFAYTLLA